MAAPLQNNGEREQKSDRSDQIELPPSIDMTISSNKPIKETNRQKDSTERHISSINPGSIALREPYNGNPLEHFKESLNHVLKNEANPSNAPPAISCYHSYETTQENATTQPKLPLQLDSIHSSNKTYVYRSFLTTYRKKNYFKL